MGGSRRMTGCHVLWDPDRSQALGKGAEQFGEPTRPIAISLTTDGSFSLCDQTAYPLVVHCLRLSVRKHDVPSRVYRLLPIEESGGPVIHPKFDAADDPSRFDKLYRQHRSLRRTS